MMEKNIKEIFEAILNEHGEFIIIFILSMKNN